MAELNSIKPNYLIEAPALKLRQTDSSLKIIDFRKKEFYNQEHIEGALQMWRTDIEDTTYSYSGMMASPKQIESLFGNLGINSTDTIIIYDDNGLCEASRLWWILQNYNFKNVKMLHGGIESWKKIDGKVTKKTPEIKKSIFKLFGEPKMQYYISKEEMLKALDKNVVLLDTRTFDEFSGNQQKKGAAKSGRIPNSIHVDWAEAIHYNGDYRLKPIKILENFYHKKLNISKNDSIILYCHSGVRSAHTTFVLTQLLGYKNVKNYDGSWTEWSHFNNLPFVNNSLTKLK
ncbi:sulfurtransferase [Polaribacter litorisediminis]|uniref:sulfurtransferase n=1 Tax=Polaribacter litorisediminis TaxID=1908341 RepID=UPI001CBDF23F|nr:sulfurtransferase [Polaribacter litorisediminis]UAM96851.1 sulfurtransferase [Polaribacter litorisediminis]